MDGMGTPKLGRAVRVLALAPVLALTACAVRPPNAVPSVAVTSAPPAPSALASAPPDSTGPLPTVGVEPSAPSGDFILGASSLDGFAFGTGQDQVTPTLTDLLGSPDDVYKGAFCEGQPNSQYSQTYTYGGLSVIFLAKDASTTGPRTLAGWTFDLSTGLADPLTLENGLPADPTFAQLQSDYPTGTLTTDQTGSVFTLPDGLRFLGSPEPDIVSAGPAGC